MASSPSFPSALAHSSAVDVAQEDDNVISLMPNCFNLLPDCDYPATTLEFQEIHRLLAEEMSMKYIEKGEKEENNLDTVLEKRMMKCVDHGDQFSGKENVPVGDAAVKQKRGVAKREGSGRAITRRPFKIDLRSFDSLVNEDMPKGQRILQEIHAFWDAEENREASEAIYKLEGEALDVNPCSRKSTSSSLKSGRRARVRRNGTGRQTVSRSFDLELPEFDESVACWDKELVEEEEERPERSCVFNNLEDQMRYDHKTDQDPSTPVVHIVDMSLRQNQLRNLIVPLSSSVDELQRETVEDKEATIYDETKLISPVEGVLENASARISPMTSPTPPANPLAAFCVTEKMEMKDTGKLLLAFNQILQLSSSDSIINTVDTNTCIEQSDNNAFLPEKASETRDVAACIGKAVNEVPSEVSRLEQEQRSPEPEFDNYGPSGIGGEDAITCKSNNSEVPRVHDLLPTYDQGTTLVPFRDTSNTVEIPLDQGFKTRKSKNGRLLVTRRCKARRHSLAGLGTRWDGGVRRSTRIKSRPLEYWRGEKFLYGRVHDSLLTVIGKKYSSPPLCWQRRGYKAPPFKVELFVSDKYAELVRFAAI